MSEVLHYFTYHDDNYPTATAILLSWMGQDSTFPFYVQPVAFFTTSLSYF